MAFVGTILQELVKISGRIRRRSVRYDEALHEKTLRRLLKRAKDTEFGLTYDFRELLRSNDIQKAFAEKVPIHDYNKLFDRWWHRTLAGEENVTWPGKIKYFALTSGTSESASKRVPVSMRQIKAVKKASIRQMLSIPELNLPPEFYQRSVLMLGGSTDLKKIPAGYEGDLSGILASRLPVWFHRFYKPGQQIASISDWETKLNEIAKVAPEWDIGIICGVPAWIKLLCERIIEYHKVDHIHRIWPNLSIYVHGGVSFTPYRESFKHLLGKEIYYLDTYLASEGFLALQNAENKKGMQLLIDNWVYFEFIPFNEENFTSEGVLKESPTVLTLNQVKENIDYAILISTCSGAWRYLIGDTIRFTHLPKFEIIITGRTKHFLSLCGEHLSVDNMNMAIDRISAEMGVNINEFTVAGEPYEGLFAHHWYLGVDKLIDPELLKVRLDEVLKALNDDYSTERKHALKEIIVEQLPFSTFYAFLEKKGKMGGQHKFPRVIKNSLYEEWKAHLESR